jgi:hypothetical protein
VIQLQAGDERFSLAQAFHWTGREPRITLTMKKRRIR